MGALLGHTGAPKTTQTSQAPNLSSSPSHFPKTPLYTRQVACNRGADGAVCPAAPHCPSGILAWRVDAASRPRVMGPSCVYLVTFLLFKWAPHAAQSQAARAVWVLQYSSEKSGIFLGLVGGAGCKRHLASILLFVSAASSGSGWVQACQKTLVVHY